MNPAPNKVAFWEDTNTLSSATFLTVDNAAGTLMVNGKWLQTTCGLQKNGVCCSIFKDCDGDGRTLVTGDCDKSCPTCYAGNLGGRSGADAKCDSDPNKPRECTEHTGAFISVDDYDDIENMPHTKGIDTSKAVVL